MADARPSEQLTDDEAFSLGVALMRQSRRIVALTGAGISTPSGIPDFRSAGSGLWEQDDPTVVISLSVFQRDPRYFYRWIRPLARASAAARPNPAHRALVELEATGRLAAIVTQNIDGLHQSAGSRNVIEIHGSLLTATCLGCGATTAGLPLLTAETPLVPSCRCGAVYKPDIVFFEEALREETIDAALTACASADLILVVGSSLEVVPAGRLPLAGLRHGAKLLIVNREPTALDDLAVARLGGDLADLLPALVAGL